MVAERHFAQGRRTQWGRPAGRGCSARSIDPRVRNFRDYQKREFATPPEELLVDRAQRLTLTAPEMTVLVGGLRALNANYGQSKHGVFTDRPETLTNDFFVNLLAMETKWAPMPESDALYEGRDQETDDVTWTATRVDLIFGSNSQLRAISEVYAAGNAQGKFVADFVKVWGKVMELDRFDLG